MEVRVKTVSDQLVSQVGARGLRPETYVEEILARQAHATGRYQLCTPEQIRSWLDALA